MFLTATKLRISQAALMAVTMMFPLAAGGPAAEDCYDRKTQPYTSVVDSHLHFRPFGGEAIPFEEVTDYLVKSGVRYANVFGIGQKVPVDTECTYYADCPGTPVSPSIKNDPARAGDSDHMKQLLDTYPNLTLDISWRVLEDLYFSKPGVRGQYATFLNSYPTRAIPGTDFVASRTKNYKVYEEELEVNSRINRELSDEAFRNIALGENYFRLLQLKERAPQVCKA